MLRVLPSWRRLASIFMIGAISAACSMPAAQASNPVLLEGPGRVSFADLGWSGDRVIASGDPAVVRFHLPEGTRQGEPIWYGVFLKFTWNDTPGSLGTSPF